MGKALLSEAEFSRAVITRARRERPDIRVQSMGKYLLLVEAAPGQRRVVSLASLYQSYCASPTTRDEVVAAFLAAQVYQQPGDVEGTFAENRPRVMPQVVPQDLVDHFRWENRELAAVGYVVGMAIAFVVDEEEGYAFITRRIMLEWGVDETVLLRTAMENLQAQSRTIDTYYRVGEGNRLSVVWETFDGYDASRMLLSRELTEATALINGNPVIAVPHRDYMVMFGDADPDFVEEMRERIREEFESQSCAITPRLFTLEDGNLVLYDDGRQRERLVN